MQVLGYLFLHKNLIAVSSNTELQIFFLYLEETNVLVHPMIICKYRF